MYYVMQVVTGQKIKTRRTVKVMVGKELYDSLFPSNAADEEEIPGR